MTPELLKRRQKAYKQLKQRLERERQLGVVQHKMEVRKALANKKEKPKTVIRAETKNSAAVLQWPTERKK